MTEERNDDPGMFPERPRMEDVLRKFFADRNLPMLGGPSGRGWSFYGSYARCAYLHFKTYESMYLGDGPVDVRWASIFEDMDEPEAREMGSLIHVVLALRYSRQLAYPDPETVIDHVAATHPQLAMDTRRIYLAYGAFCDGYGDYDHVLHVEKYLEFVDEDDGFTVTTKPDLILHERDGVVIVDNKSAARFDYVTRNEWHNSGQLRTAALVYRGMGEPWGPIRHIEINLIGKQKEPQFERIKIAPPNDDALRSHAKLLRYLDALRRQSEITDFWPRTGRDIGCSGRGTCALFSHCASR